MTIGSLSQGPFYSQLRLYENRSHQQEKSDSTYYKDSKTLRDLEAEKDKADEYIKIR